MACRASVTQARDISSGLENPCNVCGIACIRDDAEAQRCLPSERRDAEVRFSELLKQVRTGDDPSSLCPLVHTLDGMVGRELLPRKRAAYLASDFRCCSNYFADTALAAVLAHRAAFLIAFGRTCPCLGKMLNWGVCVHVIGLFARNKVWQCWGRGDILKLYTPAQDGYNLPELALAGSPPWPRHYVHKDGIDADADEYDDAAVGRWMRWHPRRQKRAWLQVVGS